MYNKGIERYLFLWSDNMRDTMILDGKIVRNKLFSELVEKLSKVSDKLQLVVIQIGKFKENELYLRQKRHMASRLGILLTEIIFEETVSKEDIISKIEELNTDSSVHGIMIQSPISSNFSFQELVDTIDPLKDIDGLTTKNQQRLLYEPSFLPCTVRGILELLDFYHIPIENKKIAILGKSRLVGYPLSILLSKNNEVALCDSKTSNEIEILKNADFVFIAIGHAKWLKKEMISEKAIIIDIGTNLVDGVLVGDADFDELFGHVFGITKVPGGVGPLTVLSVYTNLLDAYLLQKKNGILI